MVDLKGIFGSDIESQATLDEVVDRALAGLKLEGELLIAGLNRTLASLDGWTATITIPAITITLKKPQP